MGGGRRAVKSGELGRWTGTLCWVLGLAVVFCFVSGRAVRSQSGIPNIINRPAPMPTDPASSGDYDPTAMERQLNALNIERQKEMISDTNKLFKLAVELNEEVAASKSSTLTDDQLRKIAKIEKLAHGVKQKMADGVGQSAPAMQQVPVPAPGR